MLEGAFSALPETVKEGRRIVQGITVVARLFLLKTFYSAMITAAVTVIALVADSDPDYPLRPRNLSMMSTFSIGVPAFFLTIASRKPERITGKFIHEVVRLAIPGGVIAAATALFTFYIERDLVHASLAASRSATALAVCAVAVVFIACAEWAVAPGREQRLGLALLLAGLSALVFPIIYATPLRKIYDVVWLSPQQWVVALVAGLAGVVALVAVTDLVRRRTERRAAEL
jgi:cation-transporting ATPase E